MKAYLCSIGELTTGIVKEQLEKFGYQVILLDEVEPWHEKYKKFIFMAKERCIRIDADVIPNRHIEQFRGLRQGMHQANTYDMYRNDAGVTSPVFYSQEILETIRKHWKEIGRDRPEADASRLPSVNRQLYTHHDIVGLHGFYQRKEDVERHLSHKKERKQMGEYDFELINKLQALWARD